MKPINHGWKDTTTLYISLTILQNWFIQGVHMFKIGHVMQWPWIKCINLIFIESSCIHHQVKSCRAEGLSILYLETLYKQSNTSLKWKCVILQQQTHTCTSYYNIWSAQKKFVTTYATIKYGVGNLVGPKISLVWFPLHLGCSLLSVTPTVEVVLRVVGLTKNVAIRGHVSSWHHKL